MTGILKEVLHGSLKDKPEGNMILALHDRMDADELNFREPRTITHVAAALEKDEVDELLLDTMLLLHTSEFGYLSVQGTFKDSAGEEFPLSTSEFGKLVLTNTFNHPVTGETIENAREKTTPTFLLRVCDPEDTLYCGPSV